MINNNTTEIKASFQLFADTGRIDEYADLAKFAYNYASIPCGFNEEISDAVIWTESLQKQAQIKGVSVEELLKQNLNGLPVTYALVAEQDGSLVAVGSIMGSSYIIELAKKGNNKKFTKDVENAPNDWACLEYIAVRSDVQHRGLGLKMMQGLCGKAKDLGRTNVALYRGDDCREFYDKMGMIVATEIADGSVHRVSIANLIDKELSTEVITEQVTLGDVLAFLDEYDRKADFKRYEETEKLWPNINSEEITEINERLFELMPRTNVIAAVVIKSL